MALFEGERIQVTALDAVIYYRGDGLVHEYNGNLSRCELIYKLDGLCKVWFAGKEMLEGADNLRFLPQGLSNAGYAVEPIQPGDCIYFRFDCEGALPREAVSLTLKNPAPLRLLFERLHSVWMLREPGYYAKSMSLVYQIIAYVQEQLAEGYLSGRQRTILAQSMPYLEAHCFDPAFDYRRLAACASVSYSYYKRLFLKQYGVPPSRYVLNLKIRRACELLNADMLSVGQIAEQLGFVDGSYFSKVFKRETGSAPLHWKRGRLPE